MNPKPDCFFLWRLLTILGLCARLLSAAQFGDFTYTDDGSAVTITDYPANLTGHVEIPAVIDGKPVTAIGASAFQSCALTGITIPASVTSIGEAAFRLCGDLSSVTLPSGITRLENKVFQSCVSLQSIVIPAGVTDVRTSVFESCDSLASVTFPDTLQSIGFFTFRYCTGLTSVNFPQSLRSIGPSAFFGCHGLTEVAIPAAVTSIQPSTFTECGNLQSIAVSPSNAHFSSSEGVLMNKNQTTLILFPAAKGGVWEISSTVTKIETAAFWLCSNLEAIHVNPANTIYAGLDGILYNKTMTTLLRCPGGKHGTGSIPEGVTQISSRAFAGGCLTGLRLPDSLVSIEDYALIQCGNLPHITIPANVTTIGYEAFSSCTKLVSALFLGNAPYIALSVFYPVSVSFKVYYLGENTGFTAPTWHGHPAIDIGAITPVQPWLFENGLAHDSNLKSDPNADGVDLLTAYAFNLDPKANLAASMPVPVVSGNVMSLTFFAGSPGISYSVQRTGNLVDWTTEGVTLSPPDANGFRTATIGMTGSGSLLRVVMTH